jgi:VWFA-related protein
VRDHAGTLVPDLKREQFHLFDDGVEQRIDVFAEESLPLSLVILIDNDVNGKEGVQMAQSLRSLLGGISLHDEAMVCRYDVSFYAGEDFTSDLDKLMADVKGAISEIRPTPKYVPEPLVCGNSTTGSRPTKALDDAVFAAAELLNTQGAGRRKIILLISDGANEPKLNKHDFETVKEKLLYENVSVFSLATGSESAKRKFSRMEDYSHLSGGDIYFASKSRAMEQIYSRIAEQARHEYTLAYQPRNTNPDANFHPIELHVDGEELTVQTRKGYYKRLPENR